MKTVAFLGLGAMGSRIASRLVQAGFSVKVWNHIPKATETLLRTAYHFLHSTKVYDPHKKVGWLYPPCYLQR